MLLCATCGSRYDADARRAAAFAATGCPLCGDSLIELDDPPRDDAEHVHTDVARVLREHLIGVGA